MKNKLILLFFLVFSYSSFSQTKKENYSIINYQLDSILQIARDTVSYFKYFNKFKVEKLFESNIRDAANICFTTNKADQGVQLVRESLKKGQDLEEYKNILSAKDYVLLKSESCNLRNEYFKTTPKLLYDAVYDITTNYYSLVRVNMPFYKKINRIVPDSVINMLDSLIADEILETVDKYGIVTEKNGSLLCLYFFRMRAKYFLENEIAFTKLKDLYYKALINGDIKQSYYAQLVDEYEVNKTGKQLYGSLVDFEGKRTPPIKDIKNIDSLRRSINFCSLKNWYRLNNISLKYLPKNYNGR